MTPSLSDLLERAEGAEGASKALDVDIWIALGLWTPPARGERSAVCVDRWERGRLTYYCPHAPVTASLDAALALVERVLPGACWRVEKLPPAHLRGDPALPPYWATCGAAGAQEDAYAPTPALALLAAMIRALLAQTPQPEEKKDE